MANTSKSSNKSIAAVKQQFKAAGVYYTGSALAEYIKSFIPDNVTEVYDPTCGGGALLAVFADHVRKYGQELDEAQAQATADNLVNCTIAAGDTLLAPAFTGKLFEAIVANPPFSVKWSPDQVTAADERFRDAPCLPPPSKADYAFLLHILHTLSPTGTAAVLNFPGVLYRGQREGKIRRWLVEQNVIDRVELIEGGYFEDTGISTALIVMKKNRTEDYITMRLHESGDERQVPISEIRTHDFTLSPSTYIVIEESKPEIDPRALEAAARRNALQKIEAEIKFSKMVSEFEGWEYNDFLDDIISVVNKYRQQ